MALRFYDRFLAEEHAGATVEFVAIVPFFLLIAFFAIEVSIALLWIGTAEKAAQLGARLAVVSTPAVTTTSCPAAAGLPLFNCLDTSNAANTYGQQCTLAGGPCQTFSSFICNGSSLSNPCSAVDFMTIVARMSAILSSISAQNVSITYAFAGLGFAGGPTVPSVTVTLSNVPLETNGGVMTAIFARFFPAFTTIPTVSATLTGEDLNSAGAS
jgi:hypothetical protein